MAGSEGNTTPTPAAGDAGGGKPTTTENVIARDTGLSMDVNSGEFTEHRAEGTVVDLDPREGGVAKQEPQEGGEAEAEEQQHLKEKSEADANKPVVELPAYDPANADTVAQYEAAYTVASKETGGAPQLNKEAIGKEFFANQAKAGEGAKDHGHMSEGFYAWARDTFGVDQEFITDYERGLNAINREQGNSFFSQFTGGKAEYEAMIAWGKENYTPEQRNRFNELSRKGGADFSDAVDALTARYTKATGGFKAPASGEPTRKAGRRSSPQRDPGGAAAGAPSGGGGGVKGYATIQDYSRDFTQAHKAKVEAEKTGDKQAIREAEGRLREIQARGRKAGFKQG